jgi:hypothetical protein
MREQLEFKWNGRKACRRVSGSHRRRNRGRWWFEQMRQLVEQAPDGGEPDCRVTAEKQSLFQNN